MQKYLNIKNFFSNELSSNPLVIVINIKNIINVSIQNGAHTGQLFYCGEIHPRKLYWCCVTQVLNSYDLCFSRSSIMY